MKKLVLSLGLLAAVTLIAEQVHAGGRGTYLGSSPMVGGPGTYPAGRQAPVGMMVGGRGTVTPEYVQIKDDLDRLEDDLEDYLESFLKNSKQQLEASIAVQQKELATAAQRADLEKAIKAEERDIEQRIKQMEQAVEQAIEAAEKKGYRTFEEAKAYFTGLGKDVRDTMVEGIRESAKLAQNEKTRLLQDYFGIKNASTHHLVQYSATHAVVNKK